MDALPGGKDGCVNLADGGCECVREEAVRKGLTRTAYVLLIGDLRVCLQPKDGDCIFSSRVWSWLIVQIFTKVEIVHQRTHRQQGDIFFFLALPTNKTNSHGKRCMT